MLHKNLARFQSLQNIYNLREMDLPEKHFWVASYLAELDTLYTKVISKWKMEQLNHSGAYRNETINYVECDLNTTGAQMSNGGSK
jgi:hypothetical protein